MLFSENVAINCLKFQAFDSDILRNPLYSALILRLFKGSKVRLSLIHSYYNIEP